MIAVWSLLVGGAQIVIAFRTRKELPNAWTLGLGGILLVLLGVLLAVAPGAGAIGITWAIGWFVMLFGFEQLWLASEVRREAGSRLAVRYVVPRDVPGGPYGSRLQAGSGCRRGS